MDLEKPDLSEDRKGSVSPSCSICLEFVLDRGERSIAKLQCGHEFHLDCIGSAFNAKGAMQCPNCRKIEKGLWLYANGLHSSTDFDLDGWITENIYDLSYSELPFGFQWCPFRGFTRLTALLEEGDSQPNSYHDTSGSSTFSDLSSSSTSSHACPYLALHHAMNVAHSSTSVSVSENSPFHRTNLGVQSSVEMLNLHNFSSTEAQNSNWPQQSPSPSMSLVGNSDHSTSLYGIRFSRNDTSNQQRLGSFVQAHPLLHGSIAPRNGSNLVASSMGPPIIGEVRAHARSHGQAVSSSSNRAAPFAAPVRRPRSRGVALVSAPSSADISGLYGVSVSNSTTRSHQDSDRHFDRYYGWGRETFTPLPWIPLEGESQWWSPFNPNQPPQSGSFLQRGGASGDRITQNHSENGYHQRMPLPPWMPPPPPPPPYM
ncbi:E3 ubiquitin-protein ligase RFI2 [Dendrobium catenatum]|uniref:RING-type domain-containing protein n=1 Tax=Dendrobium catenatum TaxID=906689 RepID=A0A2I0WSR4_9ASPA|nr:E3 ubiquitin-protein ligase RFI2 [Dendrobium catenatum]PKU78693.1 hypothetical protein MA16_Dca000036 [Dendrobium catenatum]